MMSLKKLLRTMVIFFALFIVCAGSASAAVVGVGTINVEALRLRQEPNTESTILDTVYLGSEVIILEKANDTWYKVSYGATEGYMAAEYLDVSSSKDADLGYGQVQNVDSVLNVRSGPGTAYDKVTSLRASAIVKIIGIKDGWYYIQNNDVKGYVSGDYMVPCAEGTPTAKASFDGELSEQIVSYAKQFLGVPYVYGANGPDSFDCSGFTKYVYAHFGYSLNRTASSQMDNGREVSLSEIQPGDLIFFIYDGATTRASHVGMYVGNDWFIHASTGSERAVVLSQLLGGTYHRTIVGIRRII